MAEGEGFEPPLRFPVKRFSRPPVSTAHTTLRAWTLSLIIVCQPVSERVGLLELASENTFDVSKSNLKRFYLFFHLKVAALGDGVVERFFGVL